MTEYTSSTIDGFSYIPGFYTKCKELEIKSRLVELGGLLTEVYEIPEEDAIALTLIFPRLKLKKYYD